MNPGKRSNRDLFLLIGAAALLVIVVLAAAFGLGGQQAAPVGDGGTLRLAYFPNVTHAAAIAGVARGDFAKALGNTTLETKVVNAGPDAMQALLAGDIDLSYVGPSPAINTYLKSNGTALRLLAGASSGGAALVAREDVPIKSIKDLDGKRVADPQLGGTQDVSLRHFMAVNGLKPADKGGTVTIIPAQNADILNLFLTKQIDAAWVPEPWAARLQIEAKANLVVDERDLWPGGQFTTTVVVVSTDYLQKHPATVEAFLQAHVAEIAWLNANPDEGQKVVNDELKRLTGKALSADVLKLAWQRVRFTDDPNQTSIDAFVQAATEVGYLTSGKNDVTGMYDFGPLQQAKSGK